MNPQQEPTQPMTPPNLGIVGAPDPRNYAGGKALDDQARLAKAPLQPVSSALLELERENNRLTDALSTLFDRTRPIRSEMETPMEETTMSDYGSEIARSIADQTHRVSLARQLVEKVTRELEV